MGNGSVRGQTPLWSHKRHADCLERGAARHLHRLRTRYIVETLKQVRAKFSQPVQVLDAGCGDGIVTRALHGELRPHEQLVGLDFDYTRLLQARIEVPAVPLAAGEATSIPFAAESFDFVVLHHVIEHIFDDKAVLRECHRVLSSEGILLVGIPHEDGPMGRVLRRLHPGLYRRSEHVHFYSITSMLQLLEASGFVETSYAPFGFLVPWYYLHYLVLGCRWTFAFGHWISQRAHWTADSLIFVARKPTQAV